MESISHAFFNVANLQGIGFIDSSSKSISISDLANRATDIKLFMLHSAINVGDID